MARSRTKAPASEAESAPPPPDPTFPIVGIGASAGGLAAFEDFFSGMPSDTLPNMAFVLVQHLAPDHKSLLTDLIRRYTRMQVFEVEDGVRVQPNCTYIIPPNRDMALLNGALQLLEPGKPRGQRLPIDFFFHSLAQDQHTRAIGIILSGTGSDGTVGVRAIKSEGGLVMVQTPDSAEHDGMPRSVLATGLADFELPPAQMPAHLIAYAARAFGAPPPSGAGSAPKAETTMKKIFVLLRAQTNHDFSRYKPSTIHRRIDRRMAIHQIETLSDYLSLLQQTPAEVEALFRDLLIGVTHFFRDSKAFQTLEEQVIPGLFSGKSASTPIRVWSPGCSTGEEAYSLAILLAERQMAIKQSFKVQVFATDIDSAAIATARAGRYPASIAADMTPERLARFFKAEPDGSAYRIHKGIRDMLIFSEQNVIRDPPFTKLDLISCRNLMIYLVGELQNKLIPLFHHALNPGGVLFLGPSESVGEQACLFTEIDQKSKLYRRKEDFQDEQRQIQVRFSPPVTALGTALPRTPEKPSFPIKLTLRKITEQALLQQATLSGALVNGEGDIHYIHGRTGMFLEPAAGESGVNNILKMARAGLLRELTMALHKADTTKEPVSRPGLRVKTNGHFTRVNLTIRPVTTDSESAATIEAPLYLVVLEEVATELVAPVETGGERPVRHGRKASPAADEGSRIAALKQELQAKEEYLQSANEELETSNEELKSSNEEMQSVNEELQSTNEELETSKEELQSVNEELQSVNAELQAKAVDLSQTLNDMNNLLGGTGIGTIFVDHHLRILRFTPAVTRIISLLPTDIGRPVAHFVSNLTGYSSLVADTQAVLDTLTPKTAEAQTPDGLWYAIRILPYRTMDNVIEGAVITFVDITEMATIRESLQKANDLLRLAVVVRDAHDAITVQDLEGRILAWNPGAVRLYGWSEAEALAMNVRDRIPEGRRKNALAQLMKLGKAEVLKPYRAQRLAKDGAVKEVSIISTALVNEAGQMYAITTTERGRDPGSRTIRS